MRLRNQAAGAGEAAVIEPPARPVVPVRSLWHNPNFLKFWFGETVSLFGTQVTLLALPLTAVLVLHGGPAELGFLRFLQFIPYLLFGLAFGVWVDRSRRRPILIIANAARLVLIGMVPLLSALGQLSAAGLLLITFGVGTAAVLFDVTWMSYIPTLVEGERASLVEANAKLGATSSAADMAGPGVGGLLVSALTAPTTMAVNAASYLVSLVSLALIRLPETRPEKVKRRLSTELLEGLRFVLRNRYLRSIAVVGAFSNFFVSAILSMFVIYAVRDRGLTPKLLGVVLSTAGVGGFTGAVVAALLIRRVSIGGSYTGALSLTFLITMLIPAASGSRSTLVVLYMIAFFFAYAGMSVANVVVLSLRQAITPIPLMGRMNAAMRTVTWGLAALGGPFGGALGVLLGLRGALWVSTAGLACLLVPLLLSPNRRLREMPPMAKYADDNPVAKPTSLTENRTG